MHCTPFESDCFTIYPLFISDCPWMNIVYMTFFFYYSSQYCQGFMNLAGRPVAAFDPEGLIFAVGINSESVKLYDLRSFDKGPFSSFKFPSGKKMTKNSLNGPNFVVLCTYEFTRCFYNRHILIYLNVQCEPSMMSQGKNPWVFPRASLL